MRKLSIRERLARWIAPARPMGNTAARMYAGARMTNTTLGFGSGGNTSADQELALSLDRMRARSRQMIRDSAYAKRAQMVVVNNVIGAGVGMQAQVGTTRSNLNAPLNDRIEQAWKAWSCADACHTGGAMHFADLERMALGEVFATGEVLIRKHYRTFGSSRVPLGLEVIESERLAGDLVEPGAAAGITNEVRMGVEVDSFQRAVAYWIRRGHPGDVRSHVTDAQRYERVPAEDVYHLHLVNRWPQSRGEPWMHAVLRKLDDMNEYTQCELTAARASAAYFGTISTGEPDMAPETTVSDQPVMNIEPLSIQQLNPGEKFDFHAPNRPNAALDPFMRAMLREVAAGCGPSYESLSRDYSQTTYSSGRLGLLDDRDLWRVLQQWWLRSFRQPLHSVWLQQAVLANAIQGLSAGQYAADPAKFEDCTFKPRGWQWVDPTKEVNAYKEAIKAGFTTVTDVIAQTAGGLDVEDVIATRQRELQLFEAAGIELDTTVVEAAAPAPAAEPATEPVVQTPAPAGDDAAAEAARGLAAAAMQYAAVAAERATAVGVAASDAMRRASAVAERVSFVEGKMSAEQAIRSGQDQAHQARAVATEAELAKIAARVLGLEAQVGAAPLYASRRVTNGDEIRAWAASQGFKATLAASELHVTVAYSQTPMHGDRVPPTTPSMTVLAGARSVAPLGDGGAVVLKFESAELQQRWAQYRQAGASWDHDQYTPHITLTYEGEGVDLSKVQPYAGPILLGPETQEALNLNKADEYVEVAA